MAYMIEGEWSGYRSEQQHVVHRTFGHKKEFAERVKKIGYGIRFTDGTLLILRVKEYSHKPKSLPEIRGYASLIEDCAYAGVDSVDALYAKRKQAEMVGS